MQTDTGLGVSDINEIIEEFDINDPLWNAQWIECAPTTEMTGSYFDYFAGVNTLPTHPS